MKVAVSPATKVVAAMLVVELAAEYAAGVTSMPFEVIESEPAVAVMVFEPAVFRVTLKVPTPLLRGEAEGRVALESEDVIATLSG